MADSKASGLLFDNHPNQISNDMGVTDSSIPLSPQWLLPKPGESKAGMVAGECYPSPYSGFSTQSDTVNLPVNSGDIHGVHKKKDVFRPSFLNMESGRRDRWRDEERDTHSFFGRDRRREQDEEFENIKKIDRWTGRAAGQHFEEAHRPPSERWNDLPRETGYEQRRESKWSTCWGPDNKEASKWNDSGKPGDIANVKGFSHPVNHGKDEREGEQYRPWRRNFCQGRGKVEQPNTFGHGCGHSIDNAHSTFMQGRGRHGYEANNVNHVLSDSLALGYVPVKDDSDIGKSALFKYSRKNLLDLFRVIDTQLVHLLDGFEQVPSLTVGEAVEPLALSPPLSEELAIISGIDKGDIVSSGAPQMSKEGSAGRVSADIMQQRQITPGVKDGVTLPTNESNTGAEWLRGANSNIPVSSPQEKQVLNRWFNSELDPVDTHGKSAADKQHGEGEEVKGLGGNAGLFRSFDDVLRNRDSNSNGKVSQAGAAWYMSLPEQTNALLYNQIDATFNTHTKSADMGRLELPKHHPNERELGLPNSSVPESELKWTTGEVPAIQQLLSGTVAWEQESRKHSLTSPSPEDLFLYYKDPQGAVQGPFSGSDIIAWFEAGYFEVDLPVRLANAPLGIPFSMLGDIMPHLKTRRAPPGFCVPKANEILDISSMPATSNQGTVHTSPSGIDLMREGHWYPNGATTEAANRFFESLMANKSHPLDRIPLSEGHNTSYVQSVGMRSSESFDLLAQHLALERQRSSSSVYPHWPARGNSPLLSNSQLFPDPYASHPKGLSVRSDSSSQSSQSQNVDMMSILQGSLDRSLVNINDRAGGWSNFSAQGGFEQFQEPYGQNFHPHPTFELQQQRMTAENHPSAPNLLGQRMDNSSILTADKLLSSALPQDPRVMNLLQQQYLLQRQSQAPLPSQQLSLLDKILLLQQQQQQQQQQQHEELLRQQQQLFSQVLTDQNQRHNDASYGQLNSAASSTVSSGNSEVSSGNAAVDQLWQNLPPEVVEVGQKVPLSTMQGNGFSYSSSMPLCVAQDVGTNQQMSCSKVTSKDGDADVKEASMESRGRLILPLSVDVEKVGDDSGFSSNEQFPLVNLKSKDLASTGASFESISNSVLVDSSDITREISSRKVIDQIPLLEQITEANGLPASFLEEPILNEEKNTNLVASKEEPKPVEARVMKKSSEKKSRKQKSSKVQPSSNLSRGATKLSSSKASKQSEYGETSNPEVNFETPVTSVEVRVTTSNQVHVDTEKVNKLSSSLTKGELESVNVNVKPDAVLPIGTLDEAGSPAQKAWKAAANVKAKSLLEIQLEGQRRVKTEVAVSAITSSVRTASLSSPWAGVAFNLDPKVSSVVAEGCNYTDANLGKSASSVYNNSPGHDLSKANQKELEASDTGSGINGFPSLSSQLEALDDDDFIDAKETKKIRKKGGKGKGAGSKSSSTVSLIDAMISYSSVEKGKNSRQVQPENEVLPAPPQGPSLGDFVPWKPDLSSLSTAPAWSKDSAVPSKPTSLRDILKEQEKKSGSSQQHPTPLPTRQTSHIAQVNRVTSWSVSDASAKAASLTATRNLSSSEMSKHKGEDDLFWGSPDLSRLESKLVNLPQVGNHGSRGTKVSPAKISSSGIPSTRQKSAGGNMEISSTAKFAKSSLKGKQNGGTKQSEAMEFRDWCEKESIRLTGSKDTSFLEFCLKQPKSEAEILLVQNLGSLDTNHKFISKFLDYMEMLPAEVLDTAFLGSKDQDITSLYGGGEAVNSPGMGNLDAGTEGTVGKGGKKGKKGKKVSPSVLGFSVVSNRIMMGEIQTLDD